MISEQPVIYQPKLTLEPEGGLTIPSSDVSDKPSEEVATAELSRQSPASISINKAVTTVNEDPAEALFVAVRELIMRILYVAKDDTDVATAPNVSKAQATVWLKRLKSDGAVDKRGNLFHIKQPDLFL